MGGCESLVAKIGNPLRVSGQVAIERLDHFIVPLERQAAAWQEIVLDVHHDQGVTLVQGERLRS